MRRFLFMAIAGCTLLACNKQDTVDSTGNENSAGENSIMLSIKQDVQTKGVTDQKGDTEYAVIGSGKLYFIDALGNSIYQRELTALEITALENTTTTPGNKQVQISGVPNSAKKVYFMANIKTTAGSGYTMVEGTTSADARLRIDKLQGNAMYVPMSGLSADFVQVGTTNQYTASVTLTPVVARVEIGQLTCEKQNGSGGVTVTSDITEYKLAGVFMNNIREYVLLSGMPYSVGAPIDIKNQGGWATGWATYFNSSNPVFPFYGGGSPAAPTTPVPWVENSMVTYCSPASAGLIFYPDLTDGATTTAPAPDSKKAWAFQVVPSPTVAIGSPADVPHIILKITDIVYVENPLAVTTKYITITNYKDEDGNPVFEFKKGNVYRIENLMFTHNEATDRPYERNITVTATVSVAPWVINSITPDWTN